ncbi:MAG: hypothetical protein MUC43_03115 [Pirellula sp.]|jgi:hypothetical protein|nr:hypothetical protein [Pirellula sp.]
MRLFSIAFALSAFLTAASAFAQSNESPNSGSQSAPRIEPGSARFQETLSHQIRVERAREQRAYRQAMIRYYEAVGYDYARPVMNSGTFSIPIVPYSRNVWPRNVIIIPGGFY